MVSKPHFDLFAQAQKFSSIVLPESILDHLELTLRPFGFTHFLITGLPMPGRPVDALVLRKDWEDYSTEEGGLLLSIDPDDPIISRSLDSTQPFTVGVEDMIGEKIRPSELFLAARESEKTILVSVPILHLKPFQGAVIVAGPAVKLDRYAMLGLEFFCASAMEQLDAVGGLLVDRPGSLSARERRVLELTSHGQTANEIADVLDISQRTVHAHLQNASNKLRGRNKTHTVMQAVRYGQLPN
ncbi:MAG: helix-turn-helix transcriptional regulator [Hyphomicrobiales bacterium]|nr:MAG: helix-turn-helix transcriptional regulator [Hyphomicrobiales bacterium]